MSQMLPAVVNFMSQMLPAVKCCLVDCLLVLFPVTTASRVCSCTRWVTDLCITSVVILQTSPVYCL